jgi:hypothetical protein
MKEVPHLVVPEADEVGAPELVGVRALEAV